MGKYRPYLFLGIAIIIALIATVLVLNYVKEAGKPKEVAAPVVKKSIAVAFSDLPAGTVLQKEMIKEAEFLQASLPQGSITDSNALVGRVLIYPVKANEPIFESRLAPITIKTGGVAAVISPKKRAVSVRVDKIIGVAGFIHAGNRVDVLVTLRRMTGQTEAQITKIVLENILVLAAGPEFQATSKEEKAAPVDVITLEVTPEEAEKLALAATEGKLQLALRNFSDTEDVLTKGTTIPTLLDSYSGQGEVKATQAGPKKAVAPVRPVKRVEKPATFGVELIKGGKSSEVKVEQ